MKTAFQQFIATSEAYQQTDKLENMLVELYHPFSIIGLTETKIKSEQDNVSVLNTAMHGYHFVSQPSLSNAGGVGMYISENYKYTIRDDLSKSSKEFETLWLEIHNDSQQNFLCSVIYRHPNGNADTFISYIDSSIDKIHREGKYCVILGDFNLDLLKFETHAVTDNFMNILGTYFFQPHIYYSQQE
jgi:exonuclease III